MNEFSNISYKAARSSRPPDPKLLERPILVDKTEDGYFVVPNDFGPKDEVKWAKRRMDSARIAQYADEHCGLPNTYDPKGGYLCGGRADGSSAPCNKFIKGTGECLIRIQPVGSPALQSCGFWETQNAGDAEGRYCPKGKMSDARINFGSTKNPLGFSCQRCEYGEQILSRPDSEGRDRWCKLKGHTVGDNACCADNDPDEDEEDDNDK